MFECEYKDKCKWPVFSSFRGIQFSEIPSENDAWSKMHRKNCGGKLYELKIVRFDSDPMRKIRETYERWKENMKHPSDPALYYNRMWLFWEAISDTMEILEGKR
jgi:hypothetical protein